MYAIQRALSQVPTYENVSYQGFHCEQCAKGVNPQTGYSYCPTAEAYERALDAGTDAQFPAHGKPKRLFQEYIWTQLAIKAGLLSPLWINSRFAPFVSPFLGHWSAEKRARNLVTSAGKALIAGRINGSGSPAAATYIAVGTGTTAAAAGDTALQTETATSGLSRAAGTVSLVTTSVTNDTAQITNTFSVTGTVAVTESGVLNASSGGTLLTHQVFSAINVANGDSLQITWKIQAS